MHYDVYETIQNHRNLYENNAFWHYLKGFGTAETFFENNVSKACILTVLNTIWNCREHFKNNVFKACARKVFNADDIKLSMNKLLLSKMMLLFKILIDHFNINTSFCSCSVPGFSDDPIGIQGIWTLVRTTFLAPTGVLTILQSECILFRIWYICNIRWTVSINSYSQTNGELVFLMAIQSCHSPTNKETCPCASYHTT